MCFISISCWWAVILKRTNYLFGAIQTWQCFVHERDCVPAISNSVCPFFDNCVQFCERSAAKPCRIDLCLYKIASHSKLQLLPRWCDAPWFCKKRTVSAHFKSISSTFSIKLPRTECSMAKVNWVKYTFQDASCVAIAKVEFGSCPETVNLKLVIILHRQDYGTQWKWWSTVTAPECPDLTGASFCDYEMVVMEFTAITHDFSVF